MTEVGRGTLVIADIGGYTKYLTGVELEHSHDILADLISVVAQSKGTFSLAKLEGDAIFSYAAEGSVDASHLVAAIDSMGVKSYALFSEQCLDNFAIDPSGLDMIESTQNYDEVGQVDGHVLDMDTRWSEEQARHTLFISEDPDSTSMSSVRAASCGGGC